MSDDDEAPYIIPARVMDRKAQRAPATPFFPNRKAAAEAERKTVDKVTTLRVARLAEEAKRPKEPEPPRPAAPAPVDIKVNKPIAAFDPGPRPEMRWVDLEFLDVDHAYQRPLSSKHAKKLAADFKWLSFQPLSIVIKPDGRYTVVDGQHRLQACKAIPQITKLPCYVVPTASQQAQAQAFVEINDSHKRVSGLEKFRAALVAKDPITVAVAKACEDAGIKIVAGMAAAPMTTASPALLVSLARTHGIPPVRRGLGLMAIAWRKEPGAFSKAMMKAVILTCRYGATDASDEAMLKFMGTIRPEIYAAEVAIAAIDAGVAVGQSLLESFFERVTGREFSR